MGFPNYTSRKKLSIPPERERRDQFGRPRKKSNGESAPKEPRWTHDDHLKELLEKGGQIGLVLAEGSGSVQLATLKRFDQYTLLVGIVDPNGRSFDLLVFKHSIRAIGPASIAE